jgi:hypothetical protein
MATKRQVKQALAAHGMELCPYSGRVGCTWTATIDAVGRTSFDGDCRGICVYDYTTTAPQFWAEVIATARAAVVQLRPCPYPPGECEFHDD